ncbi:unnamed protein product, partial [Iphiclides podalirius]
MRSDVRAVVPEWGVAEVGAGSERSGAVSGQRAERSGGSRVTGAKETAYHHDARAQRGRRSYDGRSRRARTTSTVTLPEPRTLSSPHRNKLPLAFYAPPVHLDGTVNVPTPSV